MKKITKAISIILVCVFLFSLAACTKSYKVRRNRDFADWFNLAFTPTYDSFVKTDDAKDAPAPNATLLLASDKYINCVFDYMKDKKQPENGEVTEADGVYTYSYGAFKQTFEFDAKTSSIRVKMIQIMGEEDWTEFEATITQRGNKFYVQYIQPDFNDYTEIEFTSDGGSVLREYSSEKAGNSIFAQDIPENFAKK